MPVMSIINRCPAKMLVIEESLMIKPHAKLETPEEFKTHIKLDAILGNKVIADFIKPEPEKPIIEEPRCASGTRFDTMISYEWEKKHISPVPAIKAQSEARAAQLHDMNIPTISMSYLYKDLNSFLFSIDDAIKSLNESIGDLLDKDNGFTVFKFKPIAAMTDYKGVIDNNESYTKDTKLISSIIYNAECIPSLVKTRNIMNYIGVVFESTMESYDNYQQYVMHAPKSNVDTQYIRYAYLTKE